MNETGFQELFKRYNASLNDSLERKKCLDLLHEHIYLYPVKRYRADSDTSSEFYEYIYSKIEFFFTEFQSDKNISFMVFVAVRLRFYYYKFLKMKHKKEKPDELNIDWNDEASYNTLFFSEARPERRRKKNIKRVIGDALTTLDEHEEMSTRLYYGFPLRLRHLRYLFKTHQSVSVFAEYRTYLQNLIDWENKEKLIKEKIELKLRKIEIESNKNKISQELEVKREELLEDFFDVKNPTSIKKISVLLKVAVSVVHRRLSKARKKI
ncbi:MAG: hypothetical protein OEZ13_10695, partial [Spirochaetia bacterium]|nr:hypothetical protein [Spirochaetia bacterium]